ncbi:MAG: 8-amino-7-oxononanoate synthase [Solirubrobacteraceae bacterium]|nr:8-amino-7-oxononanoate synthase [Solirubrobacteraceae bacterium]
MTSIHQRLAEIDAAGLRRRLRLVESPMGPDVLLDGEPVLLLCSNDYLGLAGDPRVREAAAAAAMRWGGGAGSSRLVSGHMTPHAEFEARLAAFKGSEAALLFGSGYLANVGVLSALAPTGTIFSDALNHASIIDGCRLARAQTQVYRHNDVAHLGELLARTAPTHPKLIVTDGVFSMDGDVAPLREIEALAREHGALLVVDDAHGTGAIGPGGRGAVAAAGIRADVVVGTLGKALGSYGAYVACDRAMADLLLNTARSFIFSTGLPPASVAAAQAALEILEAEPERPLRLIANADLLRAELGLPPAATQIVPLIIGSPEAAVAASERALAGGVFAQAIRPPTVPAGTSRIRAALMATHTEDQVRHAADVLRNSIGLCVTSNSPADRHSATSSAVPASATATRLR